MVVLEAEATTPAIVTEIEVETIENRRDIEIANCLPPHVHVALEPTNIAQGHAHVTLGSAHNANIVNEDDEEVEILGENQTL